MDSTTTGGASSSSSLPSSWTYDVFLSFRGEDTRNNFTGHLYSNLIQKGIKTFIDDEVLRRGEDISQALLTAIEESRISVIVFSENYADSKWCLDELVHIFHCKESKKQKVFPIFYKVDPSDVRHQRESYGKALADHECRFKDNMEKVLRWRTTLTQAANLSGWSFSEGCHESKFIQKIVKEMGVQILDCTELDVAKYPVGIESRVRDTYRLLDVGGKDARMVGIWGAGGIGKTTIAKAVYNSISHEFEGSCFLGNVRERSMPYEGLVELQNILLYDILGAKELKLTNVDQGINLIKRRLSHKKVLIILDDVDHLDQLNKLVGGYDWFGSGSRIIITTRDEHLLTAHQVKLIYKVKELDSHEALDLFIRWNDLTGTRHLDAAYVKLAKSVVSYAQGLPLALMVLGSCLRGRSRDEWKAALDGYRRVPNQEIQEILKWSYHALEYLVKEAFLHIACFFKGKGQNHVIPILESCELDPKYSIQVLIEKALIYIEGGNILVHDLIEQMGKEIVRQESPTEPGGRSRLWYHEDVYHVLTENTGTDKVKAIMVKLVKPDDEICLNAKSFSKMKNLQLLSISNGRLSGDHVAYLSNELRFLDWPECPLLALPSSFNPKKLVQLNMPRSCLSQLGDGFKRLQNLKSINMESCKFLIKTSDFSGIPNLEVLNLEGCTSLVEVDPSVGFLQKLIRLSLKGCNNLTTFPEIVENMESLAWMDLSRTGIKELPSSIRYLTGLEILLLLECESFTNFPSSIYELQQLKVVYLHGCPKLVAFPEKASFKVSMSTESESLPLVLPSLQELDVKGGNLSEINFLATLDSVSTLFRLDLSGSEFVTLPIRITKYLSLRILDLRGCKQLLEIPELPPKIEWLDASECISLERFLRLSNILERKESQMICWMDLSNCRKLCDNLAHDVAKREDILVDHQIALFSDVFLIYSQRSKFQVVFPGNVVPKWFSWQKDLEERYCEFCFQIPENFKLENKGMALYAALDKTEDEPYPYYSSINRSSSFLAEVYIDGERIHMIKPDFGSTKFESDHVWLYYIPFSEITELDQCTSLQLPLKCRVTCQIPFNSSLSVKSFGAHLVMPKDENITASMELLDHEDTNEREVFGEDIGSSVIRMTESDDVGREESEDDYLSCKDDEDLEPMF